MKAAMKGMMRAIFFRKSAPDRDGGHAADDSWFDQSTRKSR
jgi:hypothetical protein